MKYIYERKLMSSKKWSVWNKMSFDKQWNFSLPSSLLLHLEIKFEGKECYSHSASVLISVFWSCSLSFLLHNLSALSIVRLHHCFLAAFWVIAIKLPSNYPWEPIFCMKRIILHLNNYGIPLDIRREFMIFFSTDSWMKEIKEFMSTRWELIAVSGSMVKISSRYLIYWAIQAIFYPFLQS